MSTPVLYSSMCSLAREVRIVSSARPEVGKIYTRNMFIIELLNRYHNSDLAVEADS